MNEHLRDIGKRAVVHASFLTDESRAQLLQTTSGNWDQLAHGTIWFNGKHDTRNGECFEEPWHSFAAQLAEYSHNVLQKGTGAWFTPAISKNGRCRDQDIAWVTMASFDADGVGDWYDCIKMLDAAGLAYIVQRSSSHRDDRPKFHLYLPITNWWYGKKWEWRQLYRHLVAWLSAAAKLRSDVEVPKYGFDLATDRLGQPWFLSARRDKDQPPPEIRFRIGNALDLEAFLKATEFEVRTSTTEVRPAVERRRKARAVAGGHCRSVLEHAFSEAGWIGAQNSVGARIVLCPWRSLHSSGYDYDGSSVIFPPSNRSRLGWFHCSHAHCAHRSQNDILRILPPDALQRALLRGCLTNGRT